MATTSVTPTEVHAVVDQMRAEVRAIDTTLNDLEQGHARNLADWVGNSQEAYWQAKKTWDQAILELNNLLTTSGTTLEGIAENYVRTDAQNAGAWS